MGTYSEITYVDKSTSENCAVDWLFLCDEDGGRLQSNIVAIGTCRTEGNDVYVAKDCYESIGLPDDVYVSIGDLGKIVHLKKVE